VAGYIEILKDRQKLKFCLTDSLTTVASLEPKRSSAWPRFYATTTNSPVGCAFLGSDKWRISGMAETAETAKITLWTA